MHRAIVIGNCQAKALETVLGASRAFVARFELLSFPAVHEIPETMIPALHDAIASASLVVPQLVDENYRDGIGLGTETLASLAVDATVVRWPNLYWGGYFPDLGYLRDHEGKPILDGPEHYHDRVVLNAFAEGISAANACELLSDPSVRSSAPSAAAAATGELRRREELCDVKVASFIEDKYRSDLLFFTINHPSNSMLGYLGERILERAGVEGNIDYSKIRARRWPRRRHEILGETFFPLHASHARALGLEIRNELVAGRGRYRIRGRTLKPIDVVQAYFDYYKAHPDVVRQNVQPSVAR